MRTFIAALALALILSGCAGIRMKDGELVIAKDTTASFEDLSAVRVTNRY